MISIQNVFDFCGGRNKFIEFIPLMKAEMEDIDNTRDETFDERLKVIVMVLHVHLMTEYHLTHYLEFNNANLGPLKDGDLSDAQKLDLINPSDPLVWFLVPVLRCLNKLRNRLAYDPAVIVTDQE